MAELKEIVSRIGTGERSSDDMEYEEAFEALSLILDGEPHATTVGAFFLANRWKGNDAEELAGFLDAIRARTEVAEPSADPVDCGANYDGKDETALLGVASGIVASATGTPVVVHSADTVPTGHGTTYKHVLDKLGVRTDLSPEDSAGMVDETGFGFYYRPNLSPDVTGILPLRDETGVRTFVNTVETLVNPADADVHLGSFYHLAFAKKMVGTLEGSASVDIDRVLLFQGLEGYDDIRPGYTKVVEWNGGFEENDISVDDYGAEFERGDLEVEDIAGDSARLTEEVLKGERDEGDPFTDAVAINAALRVYARDDAHTLRDALVKARDVMRSGKAADTLEGLREV